MNTCGFEGCDKPLYCKGLCSGHYAQQRLGKPLAPLGSTYIKTANYKHNGGKNKKYTDDMTCAYELCDRKPKSTDKCSSHYWQQKTYGYMWEIGKGRTVTTMEEPQEDRQAYYGKGFSTDRWCPKCRTTKDWRSYYLEQNMCRDCYKDSLRRAVTDAVVPHHSASKKKTSMDDVIKWLDLKTAATQSNDIAEETVD